MDWNWTNVKHQENRSFNCGFCGDKVSSDKGFGISTSRGSEKEYGIRICPNCKGPNFFSPTGEQYPSPAIGNPVSDVPEKVNDLYEEARRCTTTGGFTAAVLACRKILMHIAVDRGADDDLSFKGFVEYLDEEGYIPPDGKEWTDEIRNLGNEANHEIVMMDREDASKLLTFIEMLLRFNYEFPEKAKRESD